MSPTHRPPTGRSPGSTSFGVDCTRRKVVADVDSGACRGPALRVAMASGAWRWFEPKTTGRVPEPRAAMAHAVMDGEFVIAGGWDGKTAFDDAYSLDLSTFRWRKHSFSGMCDASLSDRIFFGHTSSPEGLIFVHGGASPKNLNDMFDDVLTFDAKTSKLCRLRTSGNGPGLRCRQSDRLHASRLHRLTTRLRGAAMTSSPPSRAEIGGAFWESG